MAASASEPHAAQQQRLHAAWPTWVWLSLGVLLESGPVGRGAVVDEGLGAAAARKNLPRKPNPRPPRRAKQARVADQPKAPPREERDYTRCCRETVVIPDAELSAKARTEQHNASECNQPFHLNGGHTHTGAPAKPRRPPVRLICCKDRLLSRCPQRLRDEPVAKPGLASPGCSRSPHQQQDHWHRVRVGPYASASGNGDSQEGAERQRRQAPSP